MGYPFQSKKVFFPFILLLAAAAGCTSQFQVSPSAPVSGGSGATSTNTPSIVSSYSPTSIIVPSTPSPTPTPSLPTSTPSPVTTNGSPNPTATVTFIPTPTATGCALVNYWANALQTPSVSSGTTAVGLQFSVAQYDMQCLNLPDYMTSVQFTFATTGNLNTQIQEVLLMDNGVVLSTAAFNPAGLTFAGLTPISVAQGQQNAFALAFVFSPTASGTITTALPYWSVQGYQLYASPGLESVLISPGASNSDTLSVF